MIHNPLFSENPDILVEEEVLEDVEVGKLSHLIVYNDDFNTFDWVIECFMDILKHTSEQAEQLALIIHTKGKATVKTAPFPELRAPKEALVDRGLSAVIE
ncbi:MAG: ATP-dependent Clp protease adaptor ClpS [Bacteroidetes bacterium]|nr:MAG: ATP-dependent Clp protease adaptor ClpS [Bacteroidota bacterium]